MKRPSTVEVPDGLQVFSVKETAEIGRCGLRQVYEAIREGQLYASRIGRGYRVPRQALEAWLLGPYAGGIQ